MTGKLTLLFLVLLLFTAVSEVTAGSFGAGVHSGYGFIRHREEASSFTSDVQSDARLKAFLFGVSGEYSLFHQGKFFVGITTDWAFGLDDEETWRENELKMAEGRIKFFGQFYDLRFGYKNQTERTYYRVYLSGGWDGLQFRRGGYLWRGVPLKRGGQEDYSLWRTGAGAGLGYRTGNWALDGRAAYSYYVDGRVVNSALQGVVFDTEGTCLDAGVGIARAILRNMSFYAGLSYTLIEMNEARVRYSGPGRAVLPESETEMVLGVINLTYAF